MSLVSLVSKDQSTVWRLAFGLAGSVGVLETEAALWRPAPAPNIEAGSLRCWVRRSVLCLGGGCGDQSLAGA